MERPRPRVLFVSRTRYRLPLDRALERKFAALKEQMDVRVLACSPDAAARGDETFALVPPLRPRRLDGLHFQAVLPRLVAREIRAFRPDAVFADGTQRTLAALAGRRLARRRAAVVLEVRLPRFNAWMKETGHGTGYRMGVGLNTGQVMSGNVGHERRVEYTAVGDTVNTASRIEGMTKGQPYMMFVAESTYSVLKDPPEELVFVEEFEVRGREQKLRIWGFEPQPEEAPAPAAAPAEPAPAEPAPDAPPQAEPA